MAGSFELPADWGAQLLEDTGSVISQAPPSLASNLEPRFSITDSIPRDWGALPADTPTSGLPADFSALAKPPRASAPFPLTAAERETLGTTTTAQVGAFDIKNPAATWPSAVTQVKSSGKAVTQTKTDGSSVLDLNLDDWATHIEVEDKKQDTFISLPEEADLGPSVMNKKTYSGIADLFNDREIFGSPQKKSASGLPAEVDKKVTEDKKKSEPPAAAAQVPPASAHFSASTRPDSTGAGTGGQVGKSPGEDDRSAMKGRGKGKDDAKGNSKGKAKSQLVPPGAAIKDELPKSPTDNLPGRRKTDGSEFSEVESAASRPKGEIHMNTRGLKDARKLAALRTIVAGRSPARRGPYFDQDVYEFYMVRQYLSDDLCSGLQRMNLFFCVFCPCAWPIRLHQTLDRAVPFRVGCLPVGRIAAVLLVFLLVAFPIASMVCVWIFQKDLKAVINEHLPYGRIPLPFVWYCFLGVLLAWLTMYMWARILLGVAIKYNIKTAHEKPRAFLAKSIACICNMNVRIGLHVDRAQGYVKPKQEHALMVELSNELLRDPVQQKMTAP